MYNPYTRENVEKWHKESEIHVGWVVNTLLGYFEAKDVNEITFLDIGCSSGKLTEVLCSKINVRAALLIDAVPELIDFAKEKLSRNGFHFESIVLGNCDGLTSVTFPKETDGVLNLGGASAKNKGKPDVTNVPIMKFDTLWKNVYNNFKPDAIKIDAEGLDLDILEGMKEFISSLENKPVIIFEFAGLNMNSEGQQEVKDRLKFLSDMGYRSLLWDSFTPNLCCDQTLVCIDNDTFNKTLKALHKRGYGTVK